MTFTVAGGLNIISIGLNGLGSYFRLHHPVSFVWNDYSGSIEKYLALLPLPENKRQELHRHISFNLNKDFTNAENELYLILQPLLKLLADGEYKLLFDNGRTAPVWKVSSGTTEREYNPSWIVEYPNLVELEKRNILIQEHKTYIKENNLEPYNLQLIDHATSWLYDWWGNEVYIATRPKGEINPQRVEYFQKKISSGERPFAIVMSAYFQGAYTEPETFVLDGHHKLQAYQNLDIRPAIAKIERVFKNKEEPEFDVEKLAELLYPWQIKYVLKHWEEKHEQLPNLLSNPNSVLHIYIKNGHYEEFHENGILKHSGFYVNDRPHGVIEEWHENGNRKYEHRYKNGLRTGSWKEWYPSGKIRSVYSFNEMGQYHGKNESYFENGRTSSLWQFVNDQYHGYGFSRWQHTGKMEYEWRYKDGIMVQKKSYNDAGRMIKNETYSFEQKKMVERSLPFQVDFSPVQNFFSRDNKPQRQFILMVIILLFLAVALIKKLTS